MQRSAGRSTCDTTPAHNITGGMLVTGLWGRTPAGCRCGRRGFTPAILPACRSQHVAGGRLHLSEKEILTFGTWAPVLRKPACEEPNLSICRLESSLGSSAQTPQAASLCCQLRTVPRPVLGPKQPPVWSLWRRRGAGCHHL